VVYYVPIGFVLCIVYTFCKNTSLWVFWFSSFLYRPRSTCDAAPFIDVTLLHPIYTCYNGSCFCTDLVRQHGFTSAEILVARVLLLGEIAKALAASRPQRCEIIVA